MDELIKALQKRVESGEMTISQVPTAFVDGESIVAPIPAPEPVLPTEPTLIERLAAVEATTAEIIDVLFGGV